MEVGGTLEYLSDLFGGGYSHKKKKKKKQLLYVELKDGMDCDGCELKVWKALSSMKGVKSVEINRKVTVTGYVEPSKVLKKAISTGKKAEIWPYVPYNLVAQPYAAQAYDKKAPPGYVRNVEPLTYSVSTHGVGAQGPDDLITNMFSDDNPNSCSIM